MTREEAKRKQDELAKHYSLGWWYGTECTKCCGVYPKFIVDDILGNRSRYENCHYECEVCGKRGKGGPMPYIAKERWNNGEFDETPTQLSLL